MCLCRTVRHFSAEPVADEASTAEAQPWQTRKIDSQEDADRKASHAKASTSPKPARLQVRSKEPILDDSMHPIRPHDIPRSVWTVLLRLRGAGELHTFPPLPLHCNRPVRAAFIESSVQRYPLDWKVYGTVRFCKSLV